MDTERTAEEVLLTLAKMKDLNKRMARAMGAMDYNIVVLRTMHEALDRAPVANFDVMTLTVLAEAFIAQGEAINTELTNMRAEAIELGMA